MILPCYDNVIKPDCCDMLSPVRMIAIKLEPSGTVRQKDSPQVATALSRLRLRIPVRVFNGSVPMHFTHIVPRRQATNHGLKSAYPTGIATACYS